MVIRPNTWGLCPPPPAAWRPGSELRGHRWWFRFLLVPAGSTRVGGRKWEVLQQMPALRLGSKDRCSAPIPSAATRLDGNSGKPRPPSGSFCPGGAQHPRERGAMHVAKELFPKLQVPGEPSPAPLGTRHVWGLCIIACVQPVNLQ